MIRICLSSTLCCLLLFGLVSVREGGAGDEPSLKASAQWSGDLKKLVALSRFVAERPSLLSGQPSSGVVRELSADPFGCRVPDPHECMLSLMAVVLSRQAAGSANVFSATRGAAVRVDLQRATNIWSDKDIENRWDVVKKWTDAAGPAALLVGALMLSQQRSGSSNDAAAAIIGSGAGLILIGNIGTLGQMYGGVNDKQRAQVARKTIDALQDIEVSRQAYENSQLVYGFLEGYSDRSEKLLLAMSSLSGNAEEIVREAPSRDRSKRTVELCDAAIDAVSRFTESAGFARDYAIQLRTLYQKNHDNVVLHAEKKKYADAGQSVDRFVASFDEILVPFLRGAPEEIEALQNIKAAVIANSIAHKQYF